MVRLFCYERGYATYVLPPTSLKKFATGRGAGDKSGIILAAYKKFGIDLSGRDDEADALWLAFAALRARFKLESGPSLTIQQKEGLKKIERLPDAQKFSRKR
jgi:Holliday junction resolvasome RuvABC endonuclease subunit